jgi:hypothetical protein
MELMSFFISFSIICLWGYIGYRLAQKKGRNPIFWCMLAIAFQLIPIIVLSLLSKKEQKAVQPPKIEPITPIEQTIPSDWYLVGENKEPLGPISFEELKKRFEEGTLTTQSFVWNETYTDWKKLEEDMITIKELEKKS